MKNTKIKILVDNQVYEAEIKDGNWYVEFFNTDPLVRFYQFGEVQAIINQLNSAIVKK